MDPAQWRKIEELFEAAAGMEPAQRGAFLEEKCAGDEGLRKEVESLLLHGENAGRFLQVPAGVRPLEAGQRVSHYEIQEKLGEGGMGVVYRAEDSRLRRRVAIKVLGDWFPPASGAIYDVGEVNGRPYLVMELLEGSTLRERIGGKPLPRGELTAWALQIASALEAAHAQAIIHRDLKPANIFITRAASGHPEQVKILDFGLAKRNSTAPAGEQESTPTTLTRPGCTVGTVNYMSPEQARGEEVDRRSDIFSFGAVLYEMASGQKAFPGSMAEAFAAILGRDPAPVGDAKFDAVISRALRKNPAERYQSASELLEALQQTAAPLSRRRLLYGAGAVAAAGAAAVAARAIWAPSGTAKRPTFAVVLIENLTGDPSLDWMDRGLCELLITALAQSRALAVLSTEVVRSAAAHRFRDNTKLTAERAYDVARDIHADLYASGSLFKLGPEFRLSLRAQDTKSGRLVYSGTVEGADAQALFGMTDEAAAAMLAQIAPRAQARPDSAGGLTSNVDALKAYTEAGIYYDQWLMDRADEEIRLAEISALNYNLTVARAAAARAVAISQRRPLPVAHARLIKSVALNLDGRLDDGVKVLEAARKEVPEDWEICAYLADTCSRLGRFSEAISTWGEAAHLNPNAAETYLQGAYTYAEAGDLPKALQWIERYATMMPPKNWNAASSRGDILSCNEHYEEAVEQYKIAEQIRPTPELRRLLTILGRIGEAETYLEAQSQNQRSWLAYRDIQIRKGDLDKALTARETDIRKYSDLTRWTHWPDTWNAGNLLLEQRDPEKALELGKRLPNAWAPGLRGAAHLILGDEGAAQADFAELREGIAPIVGDFMARTTESLWRIRAASCLGRYGEVADLCSRLTPSRNGARWAYSLDLVRAYLVFGRLADAEAELTWLIRLLLCIGGGPDTFRQFSMLTYLLARYHLGQVRERTGRRAEAAEWYRFFLSSFEHSAAKLPQIAEARAALKRL